MSNEQNDDVRRFDAESWVCVHCRPHSDVVQVTSNIADESTATLYADHLRAMGGHVFRCCKAGELVAATFLIKERAEKHRKRCGEECTRDVIFLLQSRRWIHNGLPDGYDTDGESIWKREDNDDEDAPEHLEWAELRKMENDDGVPYAYETWDVESVWLDRAEAERFAKSKEYNFADGWRVYGVPSSGELARLISGESSMEAVSEDLYYLQNVSAGYVGNNPLWWAESGKGYTSYIDNAQKFTQADAFKMLNEDAKKWKAWPVDVVNQATYRTVESQQLNRMQPLEAAAP